MDGLDGNGLLKTYALSMEDKMAAGAFGLWCKYLGLGVGVRRIRGI